MGLTSVVSMVSGRMSVLARADTVDSSSAALQTTYTMNPLLSISKARLFVNGNAAEPAITTTSVLPPFLALFALLVFLNERLRWNPLYTTVPHANTTTLVMILCCITQSCTLSKRDAATMATGGLAGGSGRTDVGSHVCDDRVSRTYSAAWSTRVLTLWAKMDS